MTTTATQWGVWRTGAWGNNDWRGSAGLATSARRSNDGWGGYGYEYRAAQQWNANGESWDWQEPGTWLEHGGLYSNTITAATIAIEIVAAVLTFAGAAITVNAKTNVAVASATIAYAGQLVVNTLRLGVVAATVSYAAQAIVVNAKTFAAVTAAALAYAGQPVRTVGAIAAIGATLVYAGQVIEITVTSVARAVSAGLALAVRIGL